MAESASAGAALEAMQQGIDRVAALQGGWGAWTRAGYPVEGSQAATPTPSGNDGEETGVLGRADAPVTIVEFSDYQCPYCRRYVLETFPQLRETYIDSGQVRYVFRDYPLSSHRNAQKAAEAARCAGDQGAFWAMHDQLFESQSEWAGQQPQQALDTFAGYASDLGLDGAVFQECLASGRFAAQIAQDVKDGGPAGVRGTPSFLIDGQLLGGAYPFERFQEMIESALAARRQ